MLYFVLTLYILYRLHMRLHFIPLSIIAALPYISILAAFSYIFNTAAQKCCVLYRPPTEEHTPAKPLSGITSIATIQAS